MIAYAPLFTAPHDAPERNQVGQIRRQCTSEYKIDVIEKFIRGEVLGLKPGSRIPKGVVVYQYIGISWDERSRAHDIERARFLKDGQPKENWKVRFPLLEMNGPNAPGWTRTDCERYLAERVPHTVHGSSCIHCPYHDDAEWRRVLAMGASGERLVQIDKALRTPGVIVNRGLDQKLYLHRTCKPITEVDLDPHRNQLGFAMECEGGCGL